MDGDVDPAQFDYPSCSPDANALYRQARALLVESAGGTSAGACTLAMAKMAADDFDLETAHHLAVLAASALVTEPVAQHAAYMLAGRAALATDAVEAARGCFSAATKGACAYQAYEALACLELEAGDHARAERFLHQAWSALPKDASPLTVATLRQRFGEVAIERNDFDGGAKAYHFAIESLQGCVSAEGRLLAARLRTELGDLYAACGQVERSRQAYTQAHEYYERAGLERRAARVLTRIDAIAEARV